MLGCEQAQQIITDPNTVSTIENVAETGVTLTQLLGSLWPALIPIGTAGAGVLAVYKRLKPKLIEATKSKDKYFAGGEMLTEILEDIKLNEPDIWAKIGPEIKKMSIHKDVESALKGFRGV